jgi:hemoglobin/transferrin/lactoferrin receptor protein
MRVYANSKARLLSCAALVSILATPVAAQQTTQPSNPLTMLGRLIFGAGTARIAIDVPQAVTALEQEDIDRAQADTVGDVVESVPGVSTVGSESPFGESYNIRGIGSGGAADEPRIIMQIDGVNRYYEQYRVGSLFTDPEFFERIEILRGPSSSTLYGSGAIAGVIAMDTIDAEDVLEDESDPFAFRQRLQYSDNGDGVLSTSFLAFRPDDQFSALIGYSYRDSDQIENGSGVLIPGTEGTIQTALAEFTYRFGDSLDHRLEFGYLATQSSVDDQIYNLVDATATWGTVDRDFDDWLAYLRYGYNPANPLVDLEVQLSFGSTAVDMSDPQAIFLPVTNYAYDTTSLSIQNVSEWRGARFENYLTFGLSWSEQDRVAVDRCPTIRPA